MIFVLQPFQILGAGLNMLVDLADYLRRALLPSSPPTEPVGEPYTAPFTGGQCDGGYYVEIVASYPTLTKYGYYNGQTFYNRLTESQQRTTNDFPYKFESVEVYAQSNGKGLRVNGITIAFFGLENFVTPPDTITLGRLLPVRGGSDNCGDLPNPNTPPPISSDGLAGSTPPNLTSDNKLVTGAPLVPIPSIGAALAALLAALAAASDVLAAVKLLGEMLKALGDLLAKLKDWLDDKDKDEDSKKSLYRHDYGSISKDGFLNLYPSGELNGFKPVYIDLQLLNIPVGYGRFFGVRSPNFYRFLTLGYVSFVSPSFGVLQTEEIDFTRKSFNVPDNAYGFFYHLGLDGVIRANVSMFYLKPDE